MAAPTIEQCGCGTRIQVRMLQNPRTTAQRVAAFELDAADKPIREHKCNLIANRTPIVGTGTPRVTSAIPASDPAIVPGLDLRSIYDDIDAILTAEAEAIEPPHKAVAAVYAPLGIDVVSSDDDPTVQSDFDADALIPSLNRDYMINSYHADEIMAVIKRADVTGVPQNIGLYGPAGSGKSTLGMQIGALRRSPTFVIDSTDKQTADEWFGTNTIENGTLKFVPSDLVRGIETANAVVILDDVALVQDRTIQNGLNALLDPSRRSIYVPGLCRTIRVAPGVIIVGTWNQGDAYTSATDLSLQILDRFASSLMLEIAYPSDGMLARILMDATGVNKPNADRLVRLTEWFRTPEATGSEPIEVSTRRLLAAARRIVEGATVGKAIYGSVLALLDVSDRARAYQIIDVQLAGASDHERGLWQAPTIEGAMALGDVLDARKGSQ